MSTKDEKISILKEASGTADEVRNVIYNWNEDSNTQEDMKLAKAYTAVLARRMDQLAGKTTASATSGSSSGGSTAAAAAPGNPFAAGGSATTSSPGDAPASPEVSSLQDSVNNLNLGSSTPSQGFTFTHPGTGASADSSTPSQGFTFTHPGTGANAGSSNEASEESGAAGNNRNNGSGRRSRPIIN